MAKRRPQRDRRDRPGASSPRGEVLARVPTARSALPPWGSRLAALGLVFAVALLLRYPIAAIPLERDEGEYAYMAQRWLRGEVPYKETFDQKPPGVFVAYAVALRCVGTTPAAIHWATQIYTLGTLACLFFLGRRLFSPLVGFLAALLGAFLTADAGVLGNAANTEVFMILPLAAGMLTALAAVERRSFAWSFLTGVLAAVAVLFKQVALFDDLFYLLFLLWATRRSWYLATAMLSGGVSLLVPCVAYFCLAGAGREFYDCTLGYNLSYSGEVPLSLYPAAFWDAIRVVLYTAWPIYLLAGIGLGHALLQRLRRPVPPSSRSVALVAVWLVFSFLGVVIGGRFFWHYFMQLVPPLALLAAQGAVALVQALPVPPWRKSVFACLVAGLAITYGVVIRPWYFLVGTPDQKCRALYESNPFPESPAVGRFIAEHSDPDALIFVAGSEPQIYFYADRKAATRYIFMYPLTAGFADTRQRQQALHAELVRHPPAFIVAGFVSTSFLGERHQVRNLLLGFQNLVRSSYELVAVVPYIENAAPMPLIAGPELKSMPHVSTLLAVYQRRPHNRPQAAPPSS